LQTPVSSPVHSFRIVPQPMTAQLPVVSPQCPVLPCHVAPRTLRLGLQRRVGGARVAWTRPGRRRRARSRSLSEPRGFPVPPRARREASGASLGDGLEIRSGSRRARPEPHRTPGPELALLSRPSARHAFRPCGCAFLRGRLLPSVQADGVGQASPAAFRGTERDPGELGRVNPALVGPSPRGPPRCPKPLGARQSPAATLKRAVPV